MESNSWLFAKSLIAAVGGYTTYRVFLPNSDGTPIFVAAIAIFFVLTVWDGYREVNRS